MGLVVMMKVAGFRVPARPRRAHKLVAAVLGCTLAASGAAFAATGGGARATRAVAQRAAAPPAAVPPGGPAIGSGAATPSSGAADLISAPDGADLEAFAVLHRPRTAADVVPAQAHVVFSASSGANVNLSRRVQTAAGTAYVIPGNGSMCLMSGAGSEAHPGTAGAGCVPDAAADAGYLEMEEGGEYRAGETESALTFVSGLVPDGVSEVTIHLASGSTTVVPVTENVYMREVRGTVADVTFAGPKGTMTVGGRG